MTSRQTCSERWCYHKCEKKWGKLVHQMSNLNITQLTSWDSTKFREHWTNASLGNKKNLSVVLGHNEWEIDFHEIGLIFHQLLLIRSMHDDHYCIVMNLYYTHVNNNLDPGNPAVNLDLVIKCTWNWHSEKCLD